MKALISSLFFAGALVVPSLNASTSTDQTESNAPQTSVGIPLPVWEEGEVHESFDVRIWPEDVILWLEQENLRDLIADPDTPVAERNELKRILAMQQAWRAS